MEKKHLTLKQDLYQTDNQFDVEVMFSNQIIELFPTLSPDSVRVVSKAILTKITTGVTYDQELEAMIQQVYPAILRNMG